MEKLRKNLMDKNQKQNTQEEYVEYITYLNNYKDEIQKRIDDLYKKVDAVLAAENFTDFVLISNQFIRENNQERFIISSELVDIFYISEAVEKERVCQIPVFIWNTHNTKELIDKYVLLKIMLRRIELNLSWKDQQEAFEYIDRQKISPYGIQAVLYNMISIFGHRQEIIMRIASWYLDHGNLMLAYMFLSVIKKPTNNVLDLCDQLYKTLNQGE